MRSDQKISIAGIMQAIVAAKDNESPWADQALAEAGLLMGKELKFEQVRAPYLHNVIIEVR